MNKQIFKTAPAIFAVGGSYQILVPVNCETLMWVQVGDELFFDHSNGTMRSATNVHRMTVPQALLDKEKKYTVCYRIVKKRKAYFTETEEIEEVSFDFHPVSGDETKGYLIADAHNHVVPTVGAVKKFEEKYGEIDFLILAGDVPEDSDNVENFTTIYEIASQTLAGEKPIVYAKGNHDLRGICAEKTEEYTPNLNGKSYFTFRVGNIWGISLDCGEDKADNHAEYGNTICCHQFRVEETEFIKSVIANAHNEYESCGVKHKIVVCHNPFSEVLHPPFDIEKDIFTEWCWLLKKNIKPDIMICGHLHRLEVNDVGCEADHLGQPCRVVVGTRPYSDENNIRHFIGTGFFFKKNSIEFVFNDDLGNEYMLD